MTLEPVPFAHALDEFLHDIVRALHAAIARGVAGLKSDPAETDRALAVSQEMIDLVMEGQVQEWIGEGDSPERSG